MYEETLCTAKFVERLVEFRHDPYYSYIFNNTKKNFKKKRVWIEIRRKIEEKFKELNIKDNIPDIKPLKVKYYKTLKRYENYIQKMKETLNYEPNWYLFPLFHCTYYKRIQTESEIMAAQPNFDRKIFDKFQEKYDTWLKIKETKMPDKPVLKPENRAITINAKLSVEEDGIDLKDIKRNFLAIPDDPDKDDAKIPVLSLDKRGTATILDNLEEKYHKLKLKIKQCDRDIRKMEKVFKNYEFFDDSTYYDQNTWSYDQSSQFFDDSEFESSRGGPENNTPSSLSSK